MKNWYAVKTKTGFGQQDKAQNNLLSQMIETFNPKVKVEKIKRGKVVTDIEPIFANYLFVKFDPNITSASKINNSYGVNKLLTFGDKLVKIDTLIIDALKNEHETQEKIISRLPDKDSPITINKGPFAGIQAIYKEPDGETRSILLMRILGKKQEVLVLNTDFS